MLLHFFLSLRTLEMMIEVGGHPLALTDGNLHLSYSYNWNFLNWYFNTLYILRLNSSQSRLSWGVWSKWLCGHSYHTFTTQRKPTSRGLVQYNILHVINKWWDYCRHSWSLLVLDFLFVISTRPQWLGFYGLLVCGNWLM